MNSCSGKWSFDKPVLIYVIITVLCIAGLLNSSNDMYRHNLLPTCMDGTTTTPYTGLSAPNAPTLNDRPFCTNEAASTAFLTPSIGYGYFGFSWSIFNGFQNIFVSYFFPFNAPGRNSTCPTASSEGANSITLSAGGFPGTFSVLNAEKFVTAFLGAVTNPFSPRILSQRFGLFFNVLFNNFPVEISGSTGKSNVFLRNVVDLPGPPSPGPEPSSAVTFQVATSPTAIPVATISSLNLGNPPYTVTFPSLADCASQQKVNFRQGPGDSSFNADGTIKGSQGGFCVTEQTQAGILAVPGLVVTTIVLLLILDLLMIIPASRKFRLFNVVFIVISAICLIFLIAAVATGAAVLVARAGPCFYLSSMTTEQLMPSPTRGSINGFVPSSGGTVVPPNGPHKFRDTQSGNAAVYLRPDFQVGSGAGLLVATIVLLFVFVIVFAIKTDWAGEGDKALVTANMTPL